MRDILQDLRFGLRAFLKNPSFAVHSWVCLAVGIGATTAIFSVINGVLLRPLAYRHADRLVMLWETHPEEGVDTERVRAGNFVDWRERSRTVEEMVAWSGWSPTLTGNGEAEELDGLRVSPAYFNLLGIKPILGRGFDPREEEAGRDRVIVLSRSFWQSRFGGDSGALGRTLTLDSVPYTIAGVVPDQEGETTDVWVPLVIVQDKYYRQRHYLNVIARLKPGVDLEQHQEEMAAVAAGLQEVSPDTNLGWSVKAVPLLEQIVGRHRPALFVLACAAGFVLLVSILNVANLLLVRAVARRREIAIRTAIGSTASRLVRQLVTEGLLLAALGGALGLLLAFLGLHILLAVAPGSIPRLEQVGIDLQTLLFSLAVSSLTGILVGMVPVAQAWDTRLSEALKAGGRAVTAGLGGKRLRGALVIFEIAAALCLLIGAGLLFRSFLRLNAVDPGFNPEGVLVASVSLDRSRYPEGNQQTAFFRQLTERLAALPNVESVGAVTALPIEGGIDFDLPFQVEGRPELAGDQAPQADFRVATPGYLRALEIPLRRGRYFSDYDGRDDAPPVAIVNETLVRRIWKNGNPVGERLVLEVMDQRTAFEIVGVVGDVRHHGLDSEPRMEIFVTQRPLPLNLMKVAIRTKADPLSLIEPVRQQLAELDRNQPAQSFVSLEDVVRDSLASNRFALLLLATLAGVSLVLAISGIYGLISYSVSQRTQEFGVRIALGAQIGNIRRQVLLQGARLSAAGIVLGLAVAFASSRYLASLVYGIGVNDMLTFAAVSLTVALIALIATWPPALRATRVSPVRALISE